MRWELARQIGVVFPVQEPWNVVRCGRNGSWSRWFGVSRPRKWVFERRRVRAWGAIPGRGSQIGTDAACRIRRRAAERLSGFANQNGKHRIWIEKSNLKRRNDGSFARSCSRRRDGGEMGGFLAGVDFSWGGTSQSPVRSQVGVVVEAELDKQRQ